MAAQDKQPLLVVVSGPPASGKTTLAATLAEHLRVPVLGKERFKETLYEVLGTGDEIEEKVERAGLACWRPRPRSSSRRASL